MIVLTLVFKVHHIARANFTTYDYHEEGISAVVITTITGEECAHI